MRKDVLGLCRAERGQQICAEEVFEIVGRSFGAAACGKRKSAAALLKQVTFIILTGRAWPGGHNWKGFHLNQSSRWIAQNGFRRCDD